MTRMLSAYAPHPVEPGGIGAVTVLKLVETCIVEAEGAPGAVYLDGEIAGSPHTTARRFQHAAGARRESHQGRGGVVDRDRPDGAELLGVGALGDESRRLAADLGNIAHHPDRHVDQMAAEIGDRRSAHPPVEAPVERNLRIYELI